jgi:hypothetical protein
MMMHYLEYTRRYFETPLDLRSRVLIFLAALVLIPTYFLPLWEMTLYSNQFPEGLELDIYSYKLEGGKSEYRDDLKEINALNHYIGMKPLVDDDFTEFKWIPFVIGATALLALRALVVGKWTNWSISCPLHLFRRVLALELHHKLYSTVTTSTRRPPSKFLYPHRRSWPPDDGEP